MEEIWKDIKDYEELYQVSNLGRVRSLNYNHTGKEKILKPFLNHNGYLTVCLCKKGKIKIKKVHRLVYEAFIGEIPEGYEINHISEDKQENKLSNLNLVTHKANINWGTRNERVSKKITNHPNKSKPVIQKTLQGEVIKIWPSAREIQRKLGYNNGHISACCRGKRYYNTAYGYKWEYEKAAS